MTDLVVPPQNLEPGFVKTPNAATEPAKTEPAQSEPAKTPEQSGDLNAQVQALLAALQAQNASKAAPVVPDATQAATPTGLSSLDVSTIEDPVLRSMAVVMQTVGKDLDMDRVFNKALEHGNAALLDIAYLREKGGANAPQLITIAEGIVQAVNAQADAVTNEVHALAGGPQHWDTAVAAFNKDAAVELRQVVAMMLDSKNKSQITAGAKLVVEFAKGSGLVPKIHPLVQNGGSAATAAQALTKEAFQAELRKLNPNERTYQADRQALFARRQMGRQLGQ